VVLLAALAFFGFLLVRRLLRARRVEGGS
jgi:hypothetical protein